jgi:hypothetical protein
LVWVAAASGCFPCATRPAVLALRLCSRLFCGRPSRPPLLTERATRAGRIALFGRGLGVVGTGGGRVVVCADRAHAHARPSAERARDPREEQCWEGERGHCCFWKLPSSSCLRKGPAAKLAGPAFFARARRRLAHSSSSNTYTSNRIQQHNNKTQRVLKEVRSRGVLLPRTGAAAWTPARHRGRPGALPGRVGSPRGAGARCWALALRTTPARPGHRPARPRGGPQRAGGAPAASLRASPGPEGPRCWVCAGLRGLASPRPKAEPPLVLAPSERRTSLPNAPCGRARSPRRCLADAPLARALLRRSPSPCGRSQPCRSS